MRSAPARTLKSIAALVAAVLVLTGMAAVPASAVGTRTISGFVYLGSAATPATTGDAVVQFTRWAGTHLASDEVPLAADGSFAITGLDNGIYRLDVDYRGTAGYSDMSWPNNPPGSQMGSFSYVDVSTADKTGQNVTLPLPAVLTGRVSLGIAPTYAGAGEVAVYYRTYSNGVAGAEVGPVLTDAAGYYTFGAIPAAVISLRFDYQGTGSFSDQAVVSFGPFVAGAQSGPRNVILPSATYSGKVRLLDGSGAVGGTIPDPDDVIVSYGSYNYSSATLTPIGTVALDANGTFSIPNLDANLSYKITYTYVGEDAYFPYTSLGFQVPVTNGAAYLVRNLTVTGHINIGSSAQSAGAGEVKVTYIEANGLNSTYGYGGSGYTDADGNYSISGLTTNTYFVYLEYNGEGSYPQLPIPQQGGNGVYRPTGENHNLDFTLAPINSISGAVTHNGAGVSWAHIYAVQIDPDTGEFLDEFETTPTAAGTYQFSGLPEGSYIIQFEADYYASQSYPGVSYYYQPDVIELTDGMHITGIDASMHLPGIIHGQVSGPNITVADFALQRVFAQLDVYDYSTGSWSMADVAFMDASGQYSFGNLEPDYYRVSIRYLGPLGVFRATSATLAVAEEQTAWFGATIVPTVAATNGKLIKGPGSTIYMVDAPGQLIPLRSAAAATDAGRSGTYTTVTQATLDSYFTLDEPLSSVWICDGLPYLAAEGKLWPIDEELVTGMPATELDCSGTLKATTAISGPLYLKSPSGKTFLVDADGTKHAILTNASMTAMSAPNAARAYVVNDGFLNSLPNGAVVLPVGALVRAPNQRVYFVAGFNHLVPILSWDTTTAMGLPSVYTWITAADLVGVTVDPDSAPLAEVQVCGTTTYFAAGGKLNPIDAALVAGLPQTVLDASACSVLVKSTTSVGGALFVQSTAGGAIFQITADGTKRQILTGASMGVLSAPSAAVTLKVSPAFLTARPTGTVVLPPGALVRAPNQRVYFVAGFNHLVPILSWDTTLAMGLPSVYTWITNADLVGVAVDADSAPLASVLLCGATTYFAAGGKLNPIDPALVAGLPQTVLDASACSVLVKSTTTVGGALFVQSTAGGAIFQITADGTKHQVLTTASMGLLSAPSAAVTLKVAPAFIASRPTGAAVMPPGAMVRAPNQRVYFVAGFNHLVPILTWDTTTSMGLPSVYTWITAADLVGVTVDPDSALLADVQVCGSVTYVAAGGKLNPIDPALVAGLPQTVLDASACSVLVKSTTTVGGALFVQSTAGGAIFQITADGKKHQILTAASMGLLSAPSAAVTLKVSPAFITARPTAQVVLPPGAMVRAPNQRVYFVAGFNHLVPILTWDTTSTLGLASVYTWVTNTDLVGVTVDPDSAPLANVVQCNSLTYFVAGGKLNPIDPALVAGLPQTTLDASACSVLVKSTTSVAGALFVQSTAGGAVYQLTADGTKHQMLTTASMGLLSAPSAAVTLKVAPSFLTTRPTGAVVLPPGAMVRAPNQRVYFVAGFNHLVPILTWDTTTSMGLPSVYTWITAADLVGVTVDSDSVPLSNVQVCGGVTYVAAGGKLNPIDPALVAGLPQTVLDASACSLLVKSTTTVRGALIVQSTAGGTVYQITADGTKHPLLLTTTAALLSAPHTPVTLRVPASFLNARPTGQVVLPAGAMVRAPNQRVYFVAGFNHLVPILTWDTTTSMGLPSVYTWITAADLVGVTVDPDSALLAYVQVCGSVTYVAAGGKLNPIDPALVAGLPQATLDASACSVLVKSTTSVAGALFVQSTAGGAIYQITADGTKHQVAASAMSALSAPYAPVTLKVAPAFLASLPTGAAIS